MNSFLAFASAFPIQVRVKSPRLLHLTATALLVFTASLLAASTLHADELRLMSWNVSELLTKAGVETVRIIQGLEPDVACLQEWYVDYPTENDIDGWVDAAFGTEFVYYRPTFGNLKNGIVSRWNIQTSGSWEDNYLTNRWYDWAVIDIPGDTDLQVVSVHLSASSEATRINEVLELIDYIEANFSNSHYLVIGGDFNTSTRNSEPIPTLLDDANWTGTCWVTTSDGTPQDRNGDADTNLNRNANYDWLIPNDLFGNNITDLYVGTYASPYPGGIVFDSRVFQPISDIPPVQNGDTENGDQDHCPVMKSHDVLPPPFELLVTEVAVDAQSPETHDWIEIYMNDGSYDVSNIFMTDLDSSFRLGNNGSLTMATYDVLIIHDGSGTSENDATGKSGNDLWDIYQSSLSLAATDDQFLLTTYDTLSPASNNIIDAVVWSDDDGSMTSDAVSDGNELIYLSNWGDPTVGLGLFTTSDQSPAIGPINTGYAQRVNTTDDDDVGDWTISASHSYGTPPSSFSGTVRINYQPAASATPSGGYIADSGDSYGSRNGYTYGWQ